MKPVIHPIGLCSLLGLPTVRDFLDSIWESETRLTRAVLPHSGRCILTLDQFERSLSSSLLGATGLSIVHGRVARPIRWDDADCTQLTAILEAYSKGCTLLQSGLQQRWAPLAEICRNIENELIKNGVPLAQGIGANAYLTPANAQGFDVHYDDHCAVILHLHGEKQWTVFSPQEELPMTRCERGMERGTMGIPLLETVLTPGDVLYIPRGFPHYAVTRERSSLHVTLSLRTVTWADAIYALCSEQASFRRSVRASLNLTFSTQDYFDRELIPRIPGLDVKRWIQRRLAENVARARPILNGQLRALDEMAAINSDTPVVRAPLMHCISDLDESEAVLRLPGATLRLPAVMKPVFDFVAENDAFTARNLPAVEANYDALEFTRILVRRGLVRPNAFQSKPSPRCTAIE